MKPIKEHTAATVATLLELTLMKVEGSSNAWHRKAKKESLEECLAATSYLRLAYERMIGEEDARED